MIVYCDGIFDLLHWGHIQHFKHIKTLFDDVYLIVGINTDKDATDYKRLPIVNEKLRYKMVESIKYVDKVIFPALMVMTEEFIKKHKIDLIVHGMKTEEEVNSQDIYHKIPKKLGIFKRLPYTEGISTTQIIENVPKFIKKSIYRSNIEVSSKIIEKLQLTLGTQPIKIIEIGSGNGKLLNLINEELNFELDCWGIDKNSQLVYQNYSHLFNIKSKILNVKTYKNLPFKNNFFDHVFLYQENNDLDEQVIQEMQRISNNKVFIDNITILDNFNNELWIIEKNKYNSYSALYIK